MDKELEGYQAKLKEVDLNKTRLEREIDSLPADAKYRERKLHDMTLRLDSLYDVIVELEEKIEDARLRRDAIKQQAITLENIYKIMVNFDCVYNIINDEEKRNVVTALIKEIEIYRNDESEYPLKRIGLNFPVFKDAVQKAGVGAVMTSYNPLNGIHSAENRWLITDVLRKEWGFDGIVMSDWTSTYTTLGCMESGLDLEMPKGYWLNYKMIRELLDRGIVHERQLDEKCVHILSTLIRFGLLDRPAVDSALPLDNEECRRIAYATALEGPVLLKNAGALPLDRAALKRVAVIGPNADRIPFGGGSGEVTPIEGCSTTLFSGLCAVAGREHVDTIRFGADGSFDEKAVSRASAVVVSVGFTKETEGEGFDRTFSLPEGQDELIRRVAGLNDRVVVVVNSGGEVAMPWLDEVEAVVMAWYPGQEGGRALASILSGMESPSGRLPVTFWGTLEGNPAAVYYGMRKNEIVPQKRDPFCHTVYYEGLFSGYRAAGSAGFAPLFPFGFGLTYSLFAYSDLSIQPAADGYDVSFWVRNVGKCRAADVPQVYVSECNPREPRPAKLLKGFAKVTLSADEKTRVSVHLGKDAFSHYDVASGEFRVSPGVFEVIVGANAREESLKTSLTIE